MFLTNFKGVLVFTRTIVFSLSTYLYIRRFSRILGRSILTFMEVDWLNLKLKSISWCGPNTFRDKTSKCSEVMCTLNQLWAVSLDVFIKEGLEPLLKNVAHINKRIRPDYKDPLHKTIFGNISWKLIRTYSHGRHYGNCLPCSCVWFHRR